MEGIRRIFGLSLVALASFYGLSLKAIFFLALLVLFVVFLVLPTVFHYSSTIQRHMIFLPWVKWPKYVEFDHPEREGLDGTVNFYLQTDKGVEVGVWHVLPQSLVLESSGKNISWYRESLSRGHPIVLYMHGNTGSRARAHRVDLYLVLRALDYHVICFDYRGYADSSPVIPSKRGVITDGRAVLQYIRQWADKSPILVWGHSLGTAVSSAIVADLVNEDKAPSALILESPFNNIRDEISIHPMTFLWRKMPYFHWFFTGSLHKSDVAFFSDKCIQEIHIPILILHAKDDHVVPFELGERLYQVAKSSRRPDSKPVIFVPFSEEFGYAHVFIHSAPELAQVVERFVSKSITGKWDPGDYSPAS